MAAVSARRPAQPVRTCAGEMLLVGVLPMIVCVLGLIGDVLPGRGLSEEVPRSLRLAIE